MPPLEKKNNKTLPWLNYGIGSVVVLLLAYNSLYFRKLDEVKAEASGKFDAASFAKNFLEKQLNPKLESAPDIDELTTLLSTDKNKAFDTYSHATAIGNIRYFLVKGQGKIVKMNENDLMIQTSKQQLTLAMEFIYGNALRDASGEFDITKFTKTADINNVSSELNKLIRTTVVFPFRPKAKEGDTIQFAGAVALNKEHLNLAEIEVIPALIR
jgi:predicted lipoprotein